MGFQITDGLNFISKQNFARLRNAAQVYSSFKISKIYSRVHHQGMPLSISIEPTTSCNLRCPECPSGLRSFTRPTGRMKIELAESIINQLAPTLSYLIFYFQGEPFLHPQLLEMIQMASSRKIYTAISTNAHFLNEQTARKTVESGLDRLIISIDGTTQETYESYRIGGKLDKVIEGTKNIVRLKKELKSRTPHIIFQFLVVKPNEHQINDVRKMASELGVNELKLKTAQIYEYENGSELIPTIEKYSRYKKNTNGTYSIKNQWADECWKMWHSCVVTWDGKVVPCCFDKDAHYVLGDLNQSTFKEIWEGEKYKQFRQTLFSARSSIDMCRNCSEGSTVFS
ncbi:MAG: SPASM domain-containing protein [Proteobacteria bacterium]|jgi:radical SAM protein with 4Fe4S-binding SPASM domain|nr:SPASM domain-containing protein [Pseudomonadota bacterium]MBS1950868.1 SPASM domain-containing protein [Bacteroidota bacterium]WHZ06715.1 MAG: putative Fe-S oxidoreductase, SAM radical superfamily [Cytophagales bacterium]